MNIVAKITEEDKQIVESWIGKGQIAVWLQHALDNKVRQRVDASIIEHTNLNPQKMTQADKMLILKDITLPTREQRDKAKEIKQGK